MQDLEIASPKTAFIFTTAPDTRSQNRIPSNQIIVNSLIKKIADNGNYSIFDLNEAMGGWGSIYSWFKKGSHSKINYILQNKAIHYKEIFSHFPY